MLRFLVYHHGKLADRVDLTGSYLVGSDGVPIRADIDFKHGEIRCSKRVGGPAGLALLWPVEGVGRLLLETSRVPERDKPYILQVELARGRLMRIAQKREDWGLDDSNGAAETIRNVDQSRDLLIEALQAETQAAAAQLGEKALNLAVTLGEEISRHNAGQSMERRKQFGGLPRRAFGGVTDLRPPQEAYLKRLLAVSDFVAVPFSWRAIEPAEQRFDWKAMDLWVETLAKRRVPMKGFDLVNFTESNVPDWVYIWEHDFDTIRDLVYEHVRRVINRYSSHIQVWDVVSGVHAANCLSFSFEELMELTRMCSAIAKQLVPRSTTLIDLVAPWGEYYARNPRTIPPWLYAEMLFQSGINFDAFGLQIRFGSGAQETCVRDMFQVSSMLDRFNLGKPLHITAVGVPSGAVANGDERDAGQWHGAWSDELQSLWLKEFYALAYSKPFVESVTWRPLCDREGSPATSDGLLRANLSPKPAYEELQRIRTALGRNAHASTKS